MLYEHSGLVAFDPERCCQCGACLAACPTGALSRKWQDNGVYRILIDANQCINCKQCTKICPASRLPDHATTEDDWTQIRDVFLGCSRDAHVRHNSSSGGVAREIIAGMLEQEVCDYAYCVVENEEFPWAAGACLTKGQLCTESIARSQYLPIPVCENLADLPSHGKVLLVGTNCQLIAATAFFSRNTAVELLKVGILCKQQKTYAFTRFMLNCLMGPGAPRQRIEYRGDGWPGRIRAGKTSMPWEQAAALPFGKRLWTVPGCDYCGNPLGSGADITLADPWRIVSNADGGLTMMLIHSEAGHQIVQACSERLDLSPATIEQAKRSVDWKGIKKKRRKTSIRMGQGSRISQIVLKMGNWQKRLYERTLLSRRWSRTALRILNRLPYLG